MGEETAVGEAIVALELQQASMVTLFGITFNIYAVLLTLVFIVFLIAVYRAQRVNRFDWMDMITRDGTKISGTKLLQMIGGVVATWIVIKLTLQGQLDWDIFAIYLAYVASIDGFSKFILAKYGAHASDDSAVGNRGYPGQYGYDTHPPNRYQGSNNYFRPPRGKQVPIDRHNPEDEASEEYAGEDIIERGGAKAE